MKRKCLKPKPINYKESEKIYKPGDKTIKVCDKNTHIRNIGEASSDAEVFSGICMYEGKNEIPVAIKIMTTDPSTELCVLLNKTLRKEKVVPSIYDYFKSGDRYVLVMELLGMSLCRYLTIHPNTKDYQELAKRIVNIIKIFHDAGFIHGDLHCNNVMISMDNKPYLIDFDRMSSTDTIKNDVNTLIDSLHQHPLDIASETFGYETNEYQKVLKRVEKMKDFLEMFFKEVYGQDIIDQESSSFSESESSETRSKKSTSEESDTEDESTSMEESDTEDE